MQAIHVGRQVPNSFYTSVTTYIEISVLLTVDKSLVGRYVMLCERGKQGNFKMSLKF